MSLDLRPVGLSGVLHDGQLVAVGQCRQCVHIGGEPVQVNRHYCGGARADERRYRPRVDSAGRRDVGETGSGAGPENGVERGGKGERRRDDLVAGADADGLQGDFERCRAIAHGHRMTCPRHRGTELLEAGHHRPLRELAAAQYFENEGLHVRAEIRLADTDRDRRRGDGGHAATDAAATCGARRVDRSASMSSSPRASATKCSISSAKGSPV